VAAEHMFVAAVVDLALVCVVEAVRTDLAVRTPLENGSHSSPKGFPAPAAELVAEAGFGAQTVHHSYCLVAPGLLAKAEEAFRNDRLALA
jgi:hypothetical protein